MALLLLGVTAVQADLPIHCIHSQIVGTWDLSVGAQTSTNAEKCGYITPDSNEQHFTTYSYNLVPQKTFRVTLKSPNIVLVNGAQMGTWTMVYDEGMEITVKNDKFFAFFHYVPKPGSSLKSEEVSDYVTYCDTTRIGWVRGATPNSFGCWKGRKVSARREDDNEATLLQESSALHTQDQQQQRGLLAPQSPSTVLRGSRAWRMLHAGHATRVPPPLPHQMFEPDLAFVEMVNADLDSTWTATVHKQFLGKKLSEMHSLLGVRRFARNNFKVDALRVNEAQTPTAALPAAFDWRTTAAYLTNPVLNQGSCGSCYALSSMGAYEARLGLRTKTSYRLSAQNVLSCSATNQGCEGGYPFLVAKHGAEFGFVAETCQPYRATDADRCQQTCSGKRYFLSSYGYIGGFYGGCSEAAMMNELYKKGPIVVAFQAPSSLFYYSGGVFTGPPPKSEPQSAATTATGVSKWEQTNHAVLAVGWGVLTKNGKNVPYWIMKNTWGPDWGESGYFRIRRGTDECGVESMAVFGAPA